MSILLHGLLYILTAGFRAFFDIPPTYLGYFPLVEIQPIDYQIVYCLSPYQPYSFVAFQSGVVMFSILCERPDLQIAVFALLIRFYLHRQIGFLEAHIHFSRTLEPCRCQSFDFAEELSHHLLICRYIPFFEHPLTFFFSLAQHCHACRTV